MGDADGEVDMTDPINIDAKPEREVSWSYVEAQYRAGVRSLRDIAEEVGITEGAIRKRAKRDEWVRDLTQKIHQKAEALVRNGEMNSVRKSGTQSPDGTQTDAQPKPTEKQIVDANAEVIALADLTNRKDVILGIDVSRGHLEELAALSDPRFKDDLERLGEIMQDDRKAAETFRYIISLAGRIKMAKDAASAMGTYIPMQRRILKMDVDANKSLTDLDNLLARINGTQ